MRGIRAALMVFALICLLSATAGAGDIPGRGGVLFRFSIDPNQGVCGSGNSTATNQAHGFNLRSSQTPAAMTVNGKFRFYLGSTYGPMSITFSLAGAGINQARDYIPEWGQGMEGYGKRLVSSFGQKAIKGSMQFGAGILLGEDPRYFASGRSGIWQRTLYAVGQIFVAHKDSGGIRPAYSRFAGIVGGVYISRQWHPDSDQRAEDYIYDSAISLGLDAAKGVFSEFWPSVKKLLFH